MKVRITHNRRAIKKRGENGLGTLFILKNGIEGNLIVAIVRNLFTSIMPTYDYECQKCGHRFEYFQSMKAPRLTDCPVEGCGGKVKRLLGTGAGIIFKGSGFYETDYRSDSYKKAASADKAASSSAAPASSSSTSSSSGSGSSESKSSNSSSSGSPSSGSSQSNS